MKIKQIILWGIIIRLIIAPLFFHPDIKDINLRVSFLYTDKVTNIYDYLGQNPITKVNAPDFVYPPLTYFFLGGYQFLAQPLLGNNFHSWLFDFSGLSSTTEYIYRYLLILKLPYLFFDLLVAYLLIKIFQDYNKRKRALLFWFFNPINLYAIYAIGQFDIIPASLGFLSYYLWEKKNFKLSAAFLGIGASFKTFPLLILPFYLLTDAKLKNKVLASCIALGIYFASILPYINFPAFQKYVLFSSLSQSIFELHLSFFSKDISVFMIFYIGLLLTQLHFKKIRLWALILSAFLLVFAVSNFHPQWIVWMTPFLTLAFINARVKIWQISLFCLSYFIIFALFADRFLTTALLSPISAVYLDIPTFTQLFSLGKLTFLINLNRICFALISIYLSWKSLRIR
ncbi:MAG: hypothetical protein M1142_00070 [Patescibacteria group bacterium]|nr:hypothetical protein [Patescibacteria group bacterium]